MGLSKAVGVTIHNTKLLRVGVSHRLHCNLSNFFAIGREEAIGLNPLAIDLFRSEIMYSIHNVRSMKRRAVISNSMETRAVWLTVIPWKGELYGIRKSLGMERNYATAWKRELYG